MKKRNIEAVLSCDGETPLFVSSATHLDDKLNLDSDSLKQSSSENSLRSFVSSFRFRAFARFFRILVLKSLCEILIIFFIFMIMMYLFKETGIWTQRFKLSGDMFRLTASNCTISITSGDYEEDSVTISSLSREYMFKSLLHKKYSKDFFVVQSRQQELSCKVNFYYSPKRVNIIIIECYGLCNIMLRGNKTDVFPAILLNMEEATVNLFQFNVMNFVVFAKTSGFVLTDSNIDKFTVFSSSQVYISLLSNRPTIIQDYFNSVVISYHDKPIVISKPMEPSEFMVQLNSTTKFPETKGSTSTCLADRIEDCENRPQRVSVFSDRGLVKLTCSECAPTEDRKLNLEETIISQIKSMITLDADLFVITFRNIRLTKTSDPLRMIIFKSSLNKSYNFSFFKYFSLISNTDYLKKMYFSFYCLFNYHEKYFTEFDFENKKLLLSDIRQQIIDGSKMDNLILPPKDFVFFDKNLLENELDLDPIFFHEDNYYYIMFGSICLTISILFSSLILKVCGNKIYRDIKKQLFLNQTFSIIHENLLNHNFEMSSFSELKKSKILDSISLSILCKEDFILDLSSSLISFTWSENQAELSEFFDQVMILNIDKEEHDCVTLQQFLHMFRIFCMQSRINYIKPTTEDIRKHLAKYGFEVVDKKNPVIINICYVKVFNMAPEQLFIEKSILSRISVVDTLDYFITNHIKVSNYRSDSIIYSDFFRIYAYFCDMTGQKRVEIDSSTFHSKYRFHFEKVFRSVISPINHNIPEYLIRFNRIMKISANMVNKFELIENGKQIRNFSVSKTFFILCIIDLIIFAIILVHTKLAFVVRFVFSSKIKQLLVGFDDAVLNYFSAGEDIKSYNFFKFEYSTIFSTTSIFNIITLIAIGLKTTKFKLLQLISQSLFLFINMFLILGIFFSTFMLTFYLFVMIYVNIYVWNYIKKVAFQVGLNICEFLIFIFFLTYSLKYSKDLPFIIETKVSEKIKSSIMKSFLSESKSKNHFSQEFERSQIIDIFSTYQRTILRIIKKKVGEYSSDSFVVDTLSSYFVGKEYSGSANKLVSELSSMLNNFSKFDLNFALSKLFLGEQVNHSNILAKTTQVRYLIAPALFQGASYNLLFKGMELCFKIISKNTTADDAARYSKELVDLSLYHPQVKALSKTAHEMLYFIATNPTLPIKVHFVVEFVRRIAEIFGHSEPNDNWIEFTFAQAFYDYKESKNILLRNGKFSQILSNSKNNQSDKSQSRLARTTNFVLDSLNNPKNFNFIDLPELKNCLNTSPEFSKMVIKVLYLQTIALQSKFFSKMNIKDKLNLGPEMATFGRAVAINEIMSGITDKSIISSLLLTFFEDIEIGYTKNIYDLFFLIFSKDNELLKSLFRKYSLPHYELYTYIKNEKFPKLSVGFRKFSSNKSTIKEINRIELYFQKKNKKICLLKEEEFMKLNPFSIGVDLKSYLKIYFLFNSIRLNEIYPYVSELNIFFGNIIRELSLSSRKKVFGFICDLQNEMTCDKNDNENCKELKRNILIARYLKNPTRANPWFFKQNFNFEKIDEEQSNQLFLLLKETKNRHIFGTISGNNSSIVEDHLSYLLFYHFTESICDIFEWSVSEKIMTLFHQLNDNKSDMSPSSSKNMISFDELTFDLNPETTEHLIPASKISKFFDFHQSSSNQNPTFENYQLDFIKVDANFILNGYCEAILSGNIQTAAKFYIFGVFSGLTQRLYFPIQKKIEKFIEEKVKLSPLAFRLFSKEKISNISEISDLVFKQFTKKKNEENEEDKSLISTIFDPKLLFYITELMEESNNFENILNSFIEDPLLKKFIVFLLKLRFDGHAGLKGSDQFQQNCLKKYQIDLFEIRNYYKYSIRLFSEVDTSEYFGKIWDSNLLKSVLLAETKYKLPANESLENLLFNSELPKFIHPLTPPYFWTMISLRRKNYPLAHRLFKNIMLENNQSILFSSNILKGLSQCFENPLKAIQFLEIEGLGKGERLLQLIIFFHLKYVNVSTLRFFFDMMAWNLAWNNLKAAYPIEPSKSRIKVETFVKEFQSKLERVFIDLFRRYLIFPTYHQLMKTLDKSDKDLLINLFGKLPNENEYNFLLNRTLLLKYFEKKNITFEQIESFSNTSVFNFSIQQFLERTEPFLINIMNPSEDSELIMENIMSKFIEYVKSLKNETTLTHVPGKDFGDLFIGVLLFRLSKLIKFKSFDFKSVFPQILYLTDTLFLFIEKQLHFTPDRKVFNRHQLARIFLLNFGVLMKRDHILPFSVSINSPIHIAYIIRKLIISEALPEKVILKLPRNFEEKTLIDVIFEAMNRVDQNEKNLVFVKSWIKSCKNDSSSSFKVFSDFSELLKVSETFDTNSFPDLKCYSSEFVLTGNLENLICHFKLRQNYSLLDIKQIHLNSTEFQDELKYDAFFLQAKIFKYTEEFSKWKKGNISESLTHMFFGNKEQIRKLITSKALYLKNYYKVAEMCCSVDFKMEDAIGNRPHFFKFEKLSPEVQFSFQIYHDLRRCKRNFDQKLFLKILGNEALKIISDHLSFAHAFEFMTTKTVDSFLIR